ncbi:class I SAM-dependent DNA methyltransferase [Roseovarius salinarum]|uniref:class I SAM-dependent DNA methyltransferase n=1 Tax=Roseovarius salinarum TaxID=1981892 RepID=UPI000C34B6BE|nr:methyltransferase domain-containing protein [Roseovarius salinarum]
MSDTGFLDRAYGVSGTEETRRLYDDWAATYEAEVGENGYATPGRVARALHAVAPDPGRPLLDFGCGTGLSGLALKLAGFEAVDGADLSAEMLEIAREKQVYRHTWQVEPDAGDPFEAGAYPLVAAIGVIGAGAAPAETFDTIMRLLPRGGLFAFSFNDHTLEDPAFEGRISEWADTGNARMHFREHGDHLPGIGIGSTVYVLEKT